MFHARLKELSAQMKGPEPTACRGRRNSSNVIPRTPALGQLKEHTGFLVSRSLTLPATPPDEFSNGNVLNMAYLMINVFEAVEKSLNKKKNKLRSRVGH